MEPRLDYAKLAAQGVAVLAGLERYMHCLVVSARLRRL